MSSPEAIIFSVLNRDNIMQLELIFKRLFMYIKALNVVSTEELWAK